MPTTTNIKLEEVTMSNTFGQWLEAFNANMDMIDGLPIPMEYGKNTTMEYLKFTNGKVFMWGKLELGYSYPCDTYITGGYRSKDFVIDYPIALANTKFTAIAQAKTWPFMNQVIYQSDIPNYTTFKGFFFCPDNDSGYTSEMSKMCHLLVIGDWK